MSHETLRLADTEDSVARLYQSQSVATTYIDRRFVFAWQRLLHARQVRCLQQIIDSSPGSRILEIAPGPARITSELRGVTGGTLLERSSEMIAAAKRRLEAAQNGSSWRFVQGNAFETKHASGPFDLIYTFRLIRHFTMAERLRLYEAIVSRLCPGGLLVFDVVNIRYQEGDPAQSGRCCKSQSLPVFDAGFTQSSFAREMNIAGFDIEYLHPVVVHFALQSWFSYKLHDVASTAAQCLVNLLERVPGAQPLEWIAVCRNRLDP